MNEPTLKLPRGAEELLKDFPLAEPDFEAQAKAIAARLHETKATSAPGGVSIDDLLKAPALTAEAGEPSARTRALEPPKSSFAEMARKSLQKKDDDAAQIAKELLAVTSHNRRPNAEMVERVRAAGRNSATTSPLPTGESPLNDDVQRTSGVITRAPEPPRAAPNNRGTIIGIAGGVLALAACVALFLKSGQPEQSSTEAALAAEKASVAAPPASAAARTTPSEATRGDAVLSPESLAAAPGGEASRAAAKGGLPKAGAATAPLSAPVKVAAPSATPKPEAVVLQDDPAPAPPAATELKPEAALEPPLKPAEGHTGSVPLTPSAGAVSSALGGVRGSAQQCLAGQTAPVSVSVTFAADGHVLRVGATGPAAACIQAALSKARIQPFAKESFTANTTIRPP